MGSINLKHTGSGSAIALSSDGTSLLLDGTAIGGGGGGADLYTANESSPAAQPSATGANAIAIGDSAVSSGADGIAIGLGATQTSSHNSGANAIAIGANTVADGYSTAIGAGTGSNKTTASGNSCLAIGYTATSTGTLSTAISKSRASGTSSFAASIDNNTTNYGASGANSIAMGQTAKATGSDSFSVGLNALTEGTQSVALGRANQTGGTFALALGYASNASASYSVAIGDSSTASHQNAIVIGDSVQSTAINQINLGGTADYVRISEVYTLPKVDGTASGQVLTTNGSGVVSWAAAGGGGGVTGFTSADNTSSPNNTVNIASLSVDSSSTNAGAAIVTKGTGALMLGIPDSGTTGGNVRGASAVDLGIYRTSANQVASGTESILIGNRMRASGTEAIAIGKNSYAAATRSMAIGYDSNCHASESINMMAGGSGSAGQYGVVIGPGSKCGIRGFSVSRGRCNTSHAFARSGNVQQLQTAECEYWGRTTDATLATISSEGLNQSAATSHFLELVTDGAYYTTQNFAYMSAKVIANDNTNSLLKVLELSAAFRIATDGTVTQVGTTTKTVIHSEGTALNSIDVDTTITNRRLVLDVTGVASTNIHWTAWIKLHKNRYA